MLPLALQRSQGITDFQTKFPPSFQPLTSPTTPLPPPPTFTLATKEANGRCVVPAGQQVQHHILKPGHRSQGCRTRRPMNKALLPTPTRPSPSRTFWTESGQGWLKAANNQTDKSPLMWRKPPGLPRTDFSVLRSAANSRCSVGRRPESRRIETQQGWSLTPHPVRVSPRNLTPSRHQETGTLRGDGTMGWCNTVCLLKAAST